LTLRVNQSLAKTTAIVNCRSARPPRLIQIVAPFSSRLSRNNEVGFVKNTASDVQEVMYSLADQFIGNVASPPAKRLVRFGDAPVHPQGQVPAGSIFVEVFQILFDMVKLRQSHASPR
jgi:hypothetical protein